MNMAYISYRASKGVENKEVQGGKLFIVFFVTSSHRAKSSCTSAGLQDQVYVLRGHSHYQAPSVTCGWQYLEVIQSKI